MRSSFTPGPSGNGSNRAQTSDKLPYAARLADCRSGSAWFLYSVVKINWNRAGCRSCLVLNGISAVAHNKKRGPKAAFFLKYSGAGDEIRTHDINLGKVALYP